MCFFLLAIIALLAEQVMGLCLDSSFQAVADNTTHSPPEQQCLCHLKNLTLRTYNPTLIYDLRAGGNKSVKLSLPQRGTWNTDCQVTFKLNYLSDLSDTRAKPVFTGPARQLHTTYAGSTPDHSLLSHFEQVGSEDQQVYVEYDPSTEGGPYFAFSAYFSIVFHNLYNSTEDGGIVPYAYTFVNARRLSFRFYPFCCYQHLGREWPYISRHGHKIYQSLGSPQLEVTGTITNSSSEVLFDPATAEIQFFDSVTQGFQSCGELIPFPYVVRYFYYNFVQEDGYWRTRSSRTPINSEVYYQAIYPHDLSQFPSYSVNLTDNTTASYKRAVMEPFVDGSQRQFMGIYAITHNFKYEMCSILTSSVRNQYPTHFVYARDECSEALGEGSIFSTKPANLSLLIVPSERTESVDFNDYLNATTKVCGNFAFFIEMSDGSPMGSLFSYDNQSKALWAGTLSDSDMGTYRITAKGQLSDLGSAYYWPGMVDFPDFEESFEIFVEVTKCTVKFTRPTLPLTLQSAEYIINTNLASGGELISEANKTKKFFFDAFSFESPCDLQAYPLEVLWRTPAGDLQEISAALGEAMKFNPDDRSFTFYTQNTDLSGRGFDLEIHYTLNDRLRQSTFVELSVFFATLPIVEAPPKPPELKEDLISEVQLEFDQAATVVLPGAKEYYLDSGKVADIFIESTTYDEIEAFATFAPASNSFDSLGSLILSNKEEALTGLTYTFTFVIASETGGTATFSFQIALQGKPFSNLLSPEGPGPSLTARAVTAELVDFSNTGRAEFMFSESLIILKANQAELKHSFQVYFLPAETNAEVAAAAAPYQTFDWEVDSLNSSYLTLQITFDHPLYISQTAGRRDQMAIGLLDMNWARSQNNNGLNYFEEGYVIGPFPVPPILPTTPPPGQIAQLLSAEDMEAAASSSQKALVSNFALSAVLGLSLQQMWSAINTMQIIFLMSCIQIRQQANLSEFFSILSSLLQMDLIEVDSEDTEEVRLFQEENPQLVNNGFETPVLFESAFTLVLGFGVNIAGMLLGVFLKQIDFKFRKNKELREVEANVGEVSFFRPRYYSQREQELISIYHRQQEGLAEKSVRFVIESFVYSAFLRGALEATIDLGICGLIDLKYYSKSSALRTQAISGRRAFSLVLSILSVSMYLVLPAFIYIKIVWKPSRLQHSGQSSAFAEKFGSLYEQLNPSSKSSLSYNIFFLARRILLIVVLVLMDFNSSYQIQIFTLLSFGNLLYLVSSTPLCDRKLLGLEVMNESCTLLCSYFFLSLDAISQQGRRIPNSSKNPGIAASLSIGDPLLESNIGVIIIYLVILQLLGNLGMICCSSLLDSYRESMKRRRRQKHDEDLKQHYRDFLELRKNTVYGERPSREAKAVHFRAKSVATFEAYLVQLDGIKAAEVLQGKGVSSQEEDPTAAGATRLLSNLRAFFVHQDSEQNQRVSYLNEANTKQEDGQNELSDPRPPLTVPGPSQAVKIVKIVSGPKKPRAKPKRKKFLKRSTEPKPVPDATAFLEHKPMQDERATRALGNLNSIVTLEQKELAMNMSIINNFQWLTESPPEAQAPDFETIMPACPPESFPPPLFQLVQDSSDNFSFSEKKPSRNRAEFHLEEFLEGI